MSSQEEEEGLPKDPTALELVHDKPASSRAAWTVSPRETNIDKKEGPYPNIVRCREELAAKFPGSVWRNSTTPKYEIKVELDIDAELTWNGKTNRCSRPYRVNVYYPAGFSGKIPLISYAHGFTNGGPKLDTLNRPRMYQPLAEEGFFVIAYQHNGFCDVESNQMGAIEQPCNASSCGSEFQSYSIAHHLLVGSIQEDRSLNSI